MANPVNIHDEHNKALLAEIGERLRILHALEGRQRLPRFIRQSLDRLEEIDRNTSRSSVPGGTRGSPSGPAHVLHRIFRRFRAS
jgi:hypothetical protein